MTEAHDGATEESVETSFLDDQRARLMEALEVQRGNVAALALERVGTGVAGAGKEDLDEGERSQQLVDRANSDSLEHQLTDRIGDLEAALRRTEEGTYGICAECGRAIDPARLEAVPEVTLCAPCKSAAASPLRGRR